MDNMQFDFFYNAIYNTESNLTFHLTRPKGVEKQLPLIVFVHGGAWRYGSKDSFIPLMLELTASGFVCATISYTLSDIAPFPAAIEDVKAAIRFFRAKCDEFGIDPKRVGALGGSAGGHLVSLAGTTGREAGFDVGENLDQDSSLQAVVDICGPSDFVTMQPILAGDYDETCGEAFKLFMTGPEDTLEERCRLASPITHITSKAPPFLVFQGGTDDIVPDFQSTTFVEALKNAGVSAKLILHPDAGHSVLQNNYEENVEAIKAFFAENL